MLVIFIVNRTGKKYEKQFTSYVKFRRFIAMAEHSKKITLTSYWN